MKERRLLSSRANDLRRRLRTDLDALGRELERTAGPLVREHPRAGLAAGATVGLLLGHALASRRSPGSPRRGVIRWTWGFVRDTAVFALRSAAVQSLLGGRRKPGDDQPSG